MKILITRPEDDAQETLEILSDHGFKAISHPFLKIQNMPISLELYKDVQGYIFTSKNAVRSIKDSIDEGMLVFSVGQSTAEVSRQYGFETIHTAQGNVQSLVRMINQQHPPLNLLYCRGDHVTSDLMKIDTHHVINEVVCYQSKKITSWDDDLTKEFLSNPFSHIVFASMRTLNAFQESLTAHKHRAQVEDALSRTTILCFGKHMIKYAEYLNAARVLVLKEASIQGLIQTLEDEKKIYGKDI